MEYTLFDTTDYQFKILDGLPVAKIDLQDREGKRLIKTIVVDHHYNYGKLEHYREYVRANLIYGLLDTEVGYAIFELLDQIVYNILSTNDSITKIAEQTKKNFQPKKCSTVFHNFAFYMCPQLYLDTYQKFLTDGQRFFDKRSERLEYSKPHICDLSSLLTIVNVLKNTYVEDIVRILYRDSKTGSYKTFDIDQLEFECMPNVMVTPKRFQDVKTGLAYATPYIRSMVEKREESRRIRKEVSTQVKKLLKTRFRFNYDAGAETVQYEVMGKCIIRKGIKTM